MATLTPYNILLDNPSTSGTWALGYTSGTPAPAAPATYNGTVTFTEGVHPFGTYTYVYTVTLPCDPTQTQESYVIIDFGDSYPSPNDECIGATVIPYPYGGTPIGRSGSNKSACPGPSYTLSAETPPTSWGTVLDGDVWFKVVYTVQPSAPTNGLDVQINGIPYGATGINNIQLAIYEGNSCAAMSLEDEANNGGQVANVRYIGDMSVSHNFYIRVSSINGNDGKFDITLTIV